MSTLTKTRSHTSPPQTLPFLVTLFTPPHIITTSHTDLSPGRRSLLSA